MHISLSAIKKMPLFWVLGLVAQTAFGQNQSINITYVDPLIKVFQTDVNFGNQPALADVARGEKATLQFAIRSGSAVKNLQVSGSTIRFGQFTLKAPNVRFVGYVKVGALAKVGASDRRVPKGNMFPDPLLEQNSINVPANSTQPVWLTIDIPVNTPPGLYQGKVLFQGEINGTQFRQTKDIQIQVYPVQIKNTSLWISIWPSNSKFNLLTNGTPLIGYTDAYWKIYEGMAKKMADYYQNVVLIDPVTLTTYTLKNGKYTFDFSRFDKLISIFQNAGTLKRLEGGFFGGRNGPGGWDAQYGFYYYMPQGAKMAPKMASFNNNNDLQNYYSQFIPALVKHLKEKNLFDIYYQHIGDEPTDKNYISYLAFRNFVKKLAPDLKIIDALQTTKITDNDILVVLLSDLKNNYNLYKQLINRGKETWFYTCWQPQGNYANRFIEQALIKTRYLHWINYRYKLKGYLHWAYNQWNDNPFGESSRIIQSNNETLPGGDSWIVYPKLGGFLSSIRLEAMRDGIVDYELLTMLAARNSSLSNQIASSVILDFDKYMTDVATFRKYRKQILQTLSQ